MSLRTVVLVLGDQLQAEPPWLDDFDPAQDRVVMIEASGESTHVWSHKARIVLFLSAMRHHADALAARGLPLDYLSLDDPRHAAPGLPDRLAGYLAAQRPQCLLLVEAGEWRLARAIETVAAEAGVALRVLQDPHFLCSHQDFEDFARGRKRLLMENFYRRMRRTLRVLMVDDEPAGGTWNFDHDNRKAFGAKGPGALPRPRRCPPDALTQQVMAEVEARFPDHPGSLEHFGWPVTPEDARAVLDDFLDHRLAHFGTHQDAMWQGEPFLFHSLISPALNLKLLDPREAVAGAEARWRDGRAPLSAVEGFIRQVLGWREFIRGVYWLDMPGLATANEFGHARPLPAWYWTGKTHMNCLGDAIRTTLAYGYAHHIQRLMLTGLFGLTAGIAPNAVAGWYLAVYVDAVEWVELPNVAGMALFANGGRFTSKPYAASGAYVKRMSNYCQGCRYRPEQRIGPEACPLTQFYWAFVHRHHARLAAEPRTVLMARNLERIPEAELAVLLAEAEARMGDLDRL
jgi:deoxyribodipyrimidine photolyase-related protein